MQNATLNVNGQILRWDEAKVSVFDRGYLYGDSLYEVIRSYQGQLYLLDDHLKRLEKSAALCKMTLSQNLEVYRDEIYRTFQLFKTQPENSKLEAYVRIILSRGIGKIGFSPSCLVSPTQYTLIVQPVEIPNEEKYKNGIHLQVSDRLRNDRRALDPAMKSGNYLNNLLAYLEATSELPPPNHSSPPVTPTPPFEDALLCNEEGHITEGTTFNVFYVRRGILTTPPLDIGILEGITRRKILELAKNAQLPIREVRFPRERLYQADEVFITSTLKEVLPVTRIDSIQIGKGIPGPLTVQLQEMFRTSLPRKIK